MSNDTNKATIETKNKIIRSTIELLEEEGLLGTTTQMICKKADVSPGRINYHFGSKDDLLTMIAEMIPTQVRDELARRKEQINPKDYKDVLLNSFYFDALLIKVFYTDNRYMKVYRDIYSQPFICEHIAEINQGTYVAELVPKINMTSTMARILSESNAYAITSLAKEHNYSILKRNTTLTITEFLKSQLMMFDADADKKEAIISRIIGFVNNVEFKVEGIAKVTFL